ncbi:hypothetical protein Dsin_020946 [Dipteronia sinensis]|uniref:Zinc finger PMZ-type domain-containing protein n=1 Tax=Dipteronia sinensis TaxID=43782 RepID=A0AAE0AAF6_9ROSI|nr:hypothetical protein Dsin_020946 [Dipteronia sinensis]
MSFPPHNTRGQKIVSISITIGLVVVPNTVDHDGPQNYFSFRVHYGGEFCGKLDNYIGGTFDFFDRVSLEELSLLDIDDIAIKLGYKLLVGCWIGVEGYRAPFNIGNDQQLMWFADKIPHSRVVDLYLEPMQEVKRNEMISSQQPESQYHNFGETGDDNGAEADNDNGAEADNDNGAEADNDNGAENDIEEHVPIGDEHMPTDHGLLVMSMGMMLLMSIGLLIMGLLVMRMSLMLLIMGLLVLSMGLLQEPEDLAADTCVDPIKYCDTLHVPNLPREESADGSDELRSLERLDGKEVEGGPIRKFISRSYHEFNPSHDMQDPVFKVVCKSDGCKWFVFASWLRDYKTFKIKTLMDEHTCPMSFKNKFINSKLIAEKYGDAKPRFQRLYICLNALKKGWKEECRPLLGFDGCFTKGYHIGQLLTTIGVDPNNQMYPVVYALVEFVEKVKQDSCFCYPVYSGNYKYQVTARGEDQFVVDIDKKTCACKKWQLIGISSIHGMAALLSSNRDPIDFIDNKYKKTTFLKACGKCGLEGHNRATCDKRAGSNGDRTESVTGTECGTQPVEGTQGVAGTQGESEAVEPRQRPRCKLLCVV